jgi:folylpolyglutamate synthase/dihydropteroate synthase
VNFDEAQRYLLSLGNEVLAMKLGLENMRVLLRAFENPQDNFLKVQVAGTNGKGSVCAFLNSICLHARIRTGMYTSPHLISITERVRIDGVDITEESFASLATRVRVTAETLVASGELENIPTFFEQVTAIALLAFADAKVELAILETGLGGRLDATTAANAEICAISRIDLDHQQYLGETLEEIAAEKAAIIHEGSRVVIGEQRPEAMQVILERCRMFGIAPRLASQEVTERGRNPTGREGVVAPRLASQEVTEPGRNPTGREGVVAPRLASQEVTERGRNPTGREGVLGPRLATEPGRNPTGRKGVLAPRLATEPGRNPTGREGIVDSQLEANDESEIRSLQLGMAPSLQVGFPPVSFTTGGSRYADVVLRLQGKHQIENAAVAILLAEMLGEDISISKQNIVDGLETAIHPGRLEWIGRFLLDGAHNVGGAQALRAFMDDFVSRPITIVFGSMNDKDAAEIASLLFPVADKLILTRPDNPRARSTDDLLRVVPGDVDPKTVIITQNSAEAIAVAREAAGGHHLIVVTGSLYLVGEARKLLVGRPSE